MTGRVREIVERDCDRGALFDGKAAADVDVVVDRERDRSGDAQELTGEVEEDGGRRTGRDGQPTAREPGQVERGGIGAVEVLRAVRVELERSVEREAGDADERRRAGGLQRDVAARGAHTDLAHQRDAEGHAGELDAERRRRARRPNAREDVSRGADLQHRDANGGGRAGRGDEELVALLECERAVDVDEVADRGGACDEQAQDVAAEGDGLAADRDAAGDRMRPVERRRADGRLVDLDADAGRRQLNGGHADERCAGQVRGDRRPRARVGRRGRFDDREGERAAREREPGAVDAEEDVRDAEAEGGQLGPGQIGAAVPVGVDGDGRL